MKYETLCSNYKTGGLENVDIPNKIIALQCPWIRTLYEKNINYVSQLFSDNRSIKQ